MKVFLIILILFGFFGHSQDSQASFSEALKAYEGQNFDEAQDLFNQLLVSNPNNPDLLYNLGLTEYQLGNFGKALGLWRKARSLNNSSSQIQQAIDFTEEKLFPEKSSPSFFVVIMQSLLALPLWFWLGICLLSLSLAGWWSVECGVKERRPIQQWPSLFFFCLPIFLMSASFAGYLSFANLQEKATVISRDLQTRSNPSDTAPTMAELQEGQILYVENQIDKWIQIRTERGTPGWVPETAVIRFRGI